MFCFLKNVLYVSSGLLLSLEALAVDAPKEASKPLPLWQRISVLEKKAKSAVEDPVLAMPQINFRSKYDTAPIYNQDQASLIMRQNYEAKIKKEGITPIPLPRIEIGGNLIGLAQNTYGPRNVLYTKTDPAIAYGYTPARTFSDIQLSGANLNVTSEIADWALGALRISYNPSIPSRVTQATVLTRSENSNIYLNTGFLTFGNFDKSPFYFTVGQIFLPFGEFSSSMATSTLPSRLGRFRERPVLLGWKQPGDDSTGWNAQAFGFKGDTTLGATFVPPTDVIDPANPPISNVAKFKGGKGGVIDNGGFNLAYNGEVSKAKFGFGGSWIYNISDSGGMQNTGTSTIVTNGGLTIDNEYQTDDELFVTQSYLTVQNYLFPGFGGADFNKIVHGVPAVDFRAKLDLKDIPLSFSGEMVYATRAFDPNNLSFTDNVNGGSFTTVTIKDAAGNCIVDPVTGECTTEEFFNPKEPTGAYVSAWHVEGTYKFDLGSVPSSLTLGGGTSSQALALNIPKILWGGTWRLNFSKSVSLALNFMYFGNYGFYNYATGQTLDTLNNKLTGTNQKIISAQLIGRF